MDIEIVKRVHTRRILSSSSTRRAELGAMWCERAVREHFAVALMKEGSDAAADIARAGTAIDPARLKLGASGAVLALLAKISSAREPTQPAHVRIRFVDIALQAFAHALEHLTVVEGDPHELLHVAEWISQAILALGLDATTETRAQVDDMGGLSDA